METQSHKITHGEKKIFIKYLSFISKNIIRHEEKYRLNFQLEEFNPYTANDQPIKQKLEEIMHAMGVSIMSTKRPPIGQNVEASAEDVFYTHIRNLPDWVDMEVQSIEQDKPQSCSIKLWSMLWTMPPTDPKKPTS